MSELHPVLKKWQDHFRNLKYSDTDVLALAQEHYEREVKGQPAIASEGNAPHVDPTHNVKINAEPNPNITVEKSQGLLNKEFEEEKAKKVDEPTAAPSMDELLKMDEEELVLMAKSMKLFSRRPSKVDADELRLKILEKFK